MRYSVLILLCLFAEFLPAANMVKQDLDYTDKLGSFYNPDLGFYTPQVIHFRTTAAEFKPYANRFIHLRADISEFSDNSRWGDSASYSHGTSQDLTEGFLNSFRSYLDKIRAQNSTVIVRFAYDPWYTGSWKYAKGFEMEPGQEWILRHIRQLAEVYNDYEDVITAVELGMYGPYGENHTSSLSGAKNAGEALRELIQHTKKIHVSGRTPAVIATAFGFAASGDTSYNITFDIGNSYFKAKADSIGQDIFRVGLFNDGYLGTQYDYGTWGVDCRASICREKGVAWLEKYGANTSYGGEALTTASGYKKINSAEFLAYEGFRTHTNYLNIQWNNTLIAEWKSSLFTPRDSIDAAYDSAFKYINNHLGYRYVLKSSQMMDSLGPKSDLILDLKIQNVGFGNMTKTRPVTIVLRKKNPDGSYGNPIELPQSSQFDPQAIRSRTVQLKSAFDANGNIIDYDNIETETTFDGINAIQIETKLPDSLAEGTYAAFLRISQYGNWPADSNYSTVRFANDSSYFDTLTCSNYVGEFVLSNAAPVFANIPAPKNLTAAIRLEFSGNSLSVHNAERVEIFNLTGQQIFSETVKSSNAIVSLERIPAGNFILRASNGQTQKIQAFHKKGSGILQR